MKNAPVLFSDIKLDRITVPPRRLRGLRPDVVESLVESIAKRGLLQPIRVQMKGGGGGYELVAGLHRLEAVRKLGYATIAAGVVKGLDADQALLEEIDENLICAELSPAERAYHLSERKRLYEKLYPETRHGGDRRSVSSSQNENLKAFAADTATKTGKGRSSIARDVARAGKIAVLDEIVGTSLDKGVELDALATLSEEEQCALAERAKAGEQVTARSPLNRIMHHVSFKVAMGMFRRFCDLEVDLPPELTDREVRRALNDVQKMIERLRRLESKLRPAPTEDETVDQITTLFKGLSRQKQGPCVRKLHKIATGAV
jgi:ParB family chromosome partitioning protein